MVCQSAFVATQWCFCRGAVKAVSRVAMAIDSQSANWPPALCQNSEEPHRPQNWRSTPGEDS